MVLLLPGQTRPVPGGPFHPAGTSSLCNQKNDHIGCLYKHVIMTLLLLFMFIGVATSSGHMMVKVIIKSEKVRVRRRMGQTQHFHRYY